MKLLFQIEDGIHFFKITEAVAEQDLSVLRQSLFRFFESNPSHTVLDLSEIISQVPEQNLENLIREIRTLSSSKNLHLVVAKTNLDVNRARQEVVEIALQKQIDILNHKLELREKMQREAQKLIEENEALKSNMEAELKKIDALKKESTFLSPFLEKLWSERLK